MKNMPVPVPSKATSIQSAKWLPCNNPILLYPYDIPGFNLSRGLLQKSASICDPIPRFIRSDKKCSTEKTKTEMH